MFAHKNKYFLIIENTKDIDLKNIKLRNKIYIVYRNLKKQEEMVDLYKFTRTCKLKGIKFYIANNIRLAISVRADGLYISAHNNSLRYLSHKNSKFEMIGSAHNLKEIKIKILQGCHAILYSKLFTVSYDMKSPFLGVIKFNNISSIHKVLVPLGGINLDNLNSLNMIKSSGLALMSEIKKKPAKIINRLF